jgi:hypothetical protein
MLRPHKALDVTSAPSEAVAEGPAVELLRIAGFRVQHLRLKGEKDPREKGLAEFLGEIGKDSSELRFGDLVRVDVELSQRAYLYLVAFNADGKEQLLWPADKSAQEEGDPLTAPHEVQYLHYPADNPRTGTPRGLRMSDEKDGGLQAIALIVSAEPLPPYKDYQALRGSVGWKKQPGGGHVWLADTEHVYKALLGAGVVRREPVNRPNTRPLLELAQQLKIGGVELVEVLAFPVRAQVGE